MAFLRPTHFKIRGEIVQQTVIIRIKFNKHIVNFKTFLPSLVIVHKRKKHRNRDITTLNPNQGLKALFLDLKFSAKLIAECLALILNSKAKEEQNHSTV